MIIYKKGKDLKVFPLGKWLTVFQDLVLAVASTNGDPFYFTCLLHTSIFSPENSSGVGFPFSCLEKGVGARSAGQRWFLDVPRCSLRSRLHETAVFIPARLITRNGLFAVHRSSLDALVY